MSENFGARLRQRREAQGITLDTISRETKIKLSLLEALEHDDVSQWPGGLFRRAFVRAYAQAIGLDPDVTVRELSAAHPDPAETVDVVQVMASKGHVNGSTGSPPTRLHNMVDSAIGSLSRLGRTPAAAEPEPPSQHPPVEARASELPVPDPPVPEPPSVEPVPELEPVEAAVVVEVAAIVEPPPSRDSVADLQAMADLCTEFGRVDCADAVPALLQEAAGLLSAKGVIIWAWDEPAGELKPALVHGYSERVLARLPAVTRDSDNPTAAAFRSAQVCTVDSPDGSTAALVVPMLTPAGCAGVLALELEPGGVPDTLLIRPMATILAALLAPWVGGQTLAAGPDAQSRESA